MPGTSRSARCSNRQGLFSDGVHRKTAHDAVSGTELNHRTQRQSPRVRERSTLGVGTAAGSSGARKGRFRCQLRSEASRSRNTRWATFPSTIARDIELRGDIDLDLLDRGHGRVPAGSSAPLPPPRRDRGDALPVRRQVLRRRHTYVDLRAEDDSVDAAEKWMRATTAPRRPPRGPPRRGLPAPRRGIHYFWFCRIHHIALDGFGAMALIARVAEIYTALVEGTEPPACRAEDLVRIVEDEQRYRNSERFAKDRDTGAERTRTCPRPASLAGRAAMGGQVRAALLRGAAESTATLLDEAARRR